MLPLFFLLKSQEEKAETRPRGPPKPSLHGEENSCQHNSKDYLGQSSMSNSELGSEGTDCGRKKCHVVEALVVVMGPESE